MSRVYLDWNATAPLRPEARAAMISALDVVGNPSSVHGEGREAKALVEGARAAVAEAVGCKPVEVVFTAGATEAASILARYEGAVVDETSHDALWAHHTGTGPVYAMGVANSETGVLTEAADHEGLTLLDVTQAVGRIPWSFAWSGADLAIVSAHKFGGPKGIGALIVRDGLDIPSLSRGGGQEMGRRSGTENIAGIAGMGAAISAAMTDLAAGVWDGVAKLRNILEKTIEAAAPQTIFVGKEVDRLPNTSCFTTPGWKGETQVMAMDLAGFAISAGSACSSGKVKSSRVLRAMGYSEVEAASAVRVSLGPQTTEEDIRRFADVWLKKRERHAARAA